MPDIVQDYLKKVEQALARADATEHTHRPAIKAFVEAAGENVAATNEPSRVECGAPDFAVSRRPGDLTVGYVDAEALALYEESPAAAREYLTNYSTENAEKVVRTWWAFADELVAKYDDGYVSIPGDRAHYVGYPEEWRDAVGYADGPTTYNKSR